MAAAELLVWRRDPGNGRLYQVELSGGSTVRDLLPSSGPGISCCDFYVTCNGRRLSGDEALQDGVTYSVVPRLCGGKGGFGSMLRALGAQIEKTTNREACRDLSGRRLRDVNHEKAMAEWIKKQAEREAEKEQRRLERLKRKLEEPKHFFTDPEYHKQRSDMSERLEDSVIKGLQASTCSVVSPESSEICKRKRKSPSGEEKSSKKFLWTGIEGLEVSSSSDSDSDSESPATSGSCQSGEQRLHSSESDSDEQASCLQSSITEQSSQDSCDVMFEGGVGGEQPSCNPGQEEDGVGGEQPSCDPGQEEDGVGGEQPSCDPGHVGGEQPSCEPGQEELVKQASSTAETVPLPSQIEHLRAIPEPEKLTITSDPSTESSGTDSTLFDLMSFSSAVELEALGPDKLKTELMALGLKCGGTLQERTTRLFSVRGLSREQMDPSLFAKLGKAKKK